ARIDDRCGLGRPLFDRSPVRLRRVNRVERCRERLVERIARERSAEIPRRLVEVALLETEEAESLLRAAVSRRQGEHRLPLGPRARKIAAIDGDARAEIGG